MNLNLETTSPSDLRLHAVDEQLDTVDEARIIGSEEQDGLGDLFRLADPAGGKFRNRGKG